MRHLVQPFDHPRLEHYLIPLQVCWTERRLQNLVEDVGLESGHAQHFCIGIDVCHICKKKSVAEIGDKLALIDGNSNKSSSGTNTGNNSH